VLANDSTPAPRTRLAAAADARALATETPAVEPTVTIPFPPDFFEALARRVAELLREAPPAQRYLDSEAAAAYLGIPAKTLKTKDWRDDNDVPYSYIGGRLLFDRIALDERLPPAPALRVAITASAVLPQLCRRERSGERQAEARPV
jgi:hypothetical protein